MKSFNDITVEIKNLELTDEKPTEYPLPKMKIVDPLGFAFFSMGPDCVRPQKDGRIDGVEKFLEWLPDGDSREYQLFVTEKETAYNDHVGRASTKNTIFRDFPDVLSEEFAMDAQRCALM